MTKKNEKMGSRILHLIPDDKFLDDAIVQFELCSPGMNDYVMYNRGKPSEVIYVRALDKIRFAPAGSLLYRELVVDCMNGKYSAVIFHSIPSYFAEFVASVKGSLKLAVMTWGHEIYDFINKPEYMPETRAICQSKRMDGLFGRWKAVYRSMRGSVATNPWWPVNRALRTFLTVDYICPVIDEDYFLFAQKFRWHRLPERVAFSYVDIDRLAETGQCAIIDTCILVGNSATATGNHIDVMRRLKQLGVSNRIVLPLNYGDPRYGALIREKGAELLGRQFRSLDTFLPFENYIEELRRCAYVVMGHRRQQAVGNVIMALWMGAKVFFVIGSPVYDFLIKRGFRVFLLDDATGSEFSEVLHERDVETNRKLLRSIWGREQVLQKTRKVIRVLCPGSSVSYNESIDLLE